MSEQPTARPFDDPWLQAGQDSQLEAVRRRYERTGNPLYVWRGYDICRDLLDKNVSQARHPFPTWILDYLDRVTNSLWQLHNEGLSNQQKTAPLILQAFGMSGSVFQDWDKYEAVIALGAQVARTLATFR